MPRLVPKRQFHPVPEPELVVDHPEVVLYDMLRGADHICDFLVLQARSNERDDSVFTLIRDTVPIELLF